MVAHVKHAFAVADNELALILLCETKYIVRKIHIKTRTGQQDPQIEWTTTTKKNPIEFHNNNISLEPLSVDEEAHSFKCIV